MKNKDAFSGYHPIINFLYYALVLLFSMCLMHPVYLAISLTGALAYDITLKGRKAVRFAVMGLLPMAVIAALVNPAFNHEGQTILTYLPSGNPLTLESILYGVAAAVMLASVVLWFSSYNDVMTSDKFVYLFGRMIPALSLVLSMALRFIPKFKSQMEVVSEAQSCIGRDTKTGSVIRRVGNAVKIFSIMVTWSLENAIETADSMRSRGYAFITVRIGVPAFVGTMAIRSLLSGAISFLTNNTIFYSNNWGETYKLLGQGKIRNVIPYCCLIFLVICVACYIFLEHTKTGRYIYATGANRSAAKNVGIPVVRMQVLSFAIGALLAGIGGILHSSRNFQTSVQMGIDLQLPAQICCLLGATYKTPGKYNVPGCVVGILLTTIITNGVYGTIGSSIYIKSLVEGLVFMTAIGIIATIRQEGLPKVKFDI